MMIMMNGGFKRAWGEIIIIYFESLSSHFFEVTDENTMNPG
jgi:hypothetical protein